MIAIVLAAGLATRLYPLTRNTPKALLDVAGRPVLDWVLDALRDVPGLERIVVRVHARFDAQFARWRASVRFPVPIDLLENGIHERDRAHGALRDLALTWEVLPRQRDVLICSADNVPRFSFAPLVEAFHESGDPCLFFREAPGAVPSRRHGIVAVDAMGRVTSFEEKPARPRTHCIACSLYVFPSPVRDLLRTYLDSGHNPDAPGHFLAWMVDRRVVRAVACPGELLDTGSLDGLTRARERLAGTRPRGDETF